jgi:polysaccharide biosynthesis PFTS motif protein
MLRDKMRNLEWLLESTLINDRVQLHNLRLKKKGKNSFIDTKKVSEVIYIIRFFLLVVSSVLEIFRKSKPKSSLEKTSLVYDLTRQHLPPNIKAQELYEFFFQPDRRIIDKNSKIVTLIKKTSSAKNDNYKSIYFKKSFISYIISNEKTLFRRLRLVFFALVQTAYFTVSSIKTKHLKYILNEIFEIALFLSSTAKGSLNEIIITNNSFFNYPAISFIPKNKRKFIVVMIHYSENAFDWTKKPSQQDLSWISFAKADKHKVWTQEYAKYLTDLNIQGEVESCGSIIFRPKIDYSFEQNNVIKIAVFDVTPSLTEDQFGPYNLSSGLSFLRCINSFYTTNRKIYGDNLELVFKAKRRDIPEHFSEYINSRKELFSLRGVRGAKWSDNMYEIIASSNFVICMVGTSPALVAKELKIPVVYLHVGDVLTFEPPVDNGIIVLNSLEELIRNFQRILQ